MVYYLIGIKGSALSALAKILLDYGHEVYGIDIKNDFYTCSGLERCIIYDFDEYKLVPATYIIGNAFINHSILNEIKKEGYEIYNYPSFLNYFFKEKMLVSVAGSHGKTTTTKLLSDIIGDCTYLIGDGSGKGSNSNLFVLESCEYRNTFLNYRPYISLILNIDYDHPDFFKTKEEYILAFDNFINQSQIVIINGDDLNAKNIIKSNHITFGLNKDNDIVFSYKENNSNSLITIGEKEFLFPYLGLHYAYDFVGAYIVSKLLGIIDEDIKEKTTSLTLPKRRLETKMINDCNVIFDYAHHPTEIKCVYNTLRKYNKRIVAFFQPHTESRSQAFLEEFKNSLDLFNEVYLISIFSSVRETIDLNEERRIFDFWGYKQISLDEIENYIVNNEDIYVILGAGDIYDKICKNIN